MRRFSYTIKTAEGDEYVIFISPVSKQSLWEELIAELEGIELYEISLNRMSGSNPTSSSLLFEISEFIAQTVIRHPDAIFYYYCDDMHDIPRRDKNITPQAFRSRLFSRMFERYVQKYHVNDIVDTPGTFRSDRDIYIHFIAHARHHHAVQLLKQAIIDMGDK